MFVGGGEEIEEEKGQGLPAKIGSVWTCSGTFVDTVWHPGYPGEGFAYKKPKSVVVKRNSIT